MLTRRRSDRRRRRRPTARVAAALLASLLAVVALTAAAAAAVRSSRGSVPPSTRVVALPVSPGVGATARAVAPRLGPGARLPAIPGPPLSDVPQPERPVEPPVVTVPTPTVPSRAIGRPNAGRLENGVVLPAEGADHTTWDAIEHVTPNRDWRRVGTDRLVRIVLTVAADFRRAHPTASRVVISDLSLPEGGPFGPGYGGLGHASHQNGLDVDIAYPRTDGQEVGVERVGQIDRVLSQALVDAFVDAGAQYVFVGPNTRLRGPRAVVQRLADHDDHLHVRIPNVD